MLGSHLGCPGYIRQPPKHSETARNNSKAHFGRAPTLASYTASVRALPNSRNRNGFGAGAPENPMTGAVGGSGSQENVAPSGSSGSSMSTAPFTPKVWRKRRYLRALRPGLALCFLGPGAKPKLEAPNKQNLPTSLYQLQSLFRCIIKKILW